MVPVSPEQAALSESLKLLREALDEVRNQKPNDRSELDRVYAVVITDIEKVIAYLHYIGWPLVDPELKNIP